MKTQLNDVLVERNGEWFLLSKNGERVLRKFGKEKPSPEKLAEIEKTIEYFKHRSDDRDTPLRNQIKMATRNGRIKPRKFPRMGDSKAIERRYQKQMSSIFRGILRIIKENVLAELPSIFNEMEIERADSERYDQDFAKRILEMMSRTRTQIELLYGIRQITRLAETFASTTDDYANKELKKGFNASYGIEIETESPFVAELQDFFVASNVNLIDDVKNQLLNDIQTVVTDGARRGLRPNEIASKILTRTTDKEGFKGRFKKAETRAKFIARDQVSKLYGAVNEERQRSVGITKYIWRTARDERVRDTHQLEGEIFSWDKSKSESGRVKPRGSLNPGEDFNCRCYAEPYIEELNE